jgi:hypothetical protein
VNTIINSAKKLFDDQRRQSVGRPLLMGIDQRWLKWSDEQHSCSSLLLKTTPCYFVSPSNRNTKKTQEATKIIFLKQIVSWVDFLPTDGIFTV